MSRLNNYTRGTLRRPEPKGYPDDLYLWGGRVLGAVAVICAILYVVGGFQ